jgi:hypothetical protein
MRSNHYDCPPECCGTFMDKQDDGTFKCFYCKSIDKDEKTEWIDLFVENINETPE